MNTRHSSYNRIEGHGLVQISNADFLRNSVYSFLKALSIISSFILRIRQQSPFLSYNHNLPPKNTPYFAKVEPHLSGTVAHKNSWPRVAKHRHISRVEWRAN